MQKLLRRTNTCRKHTFFCGEIYLKFVTLRYLILPDISSEKNPNTQQKTCQNFPTNKKTPSGAKTSSSRNPSFLAGCFFSTKPSDNHCPREVVKLHIDYLHCWPWILLNQKVFVCFVTRRFNPLEQTINPSFPGQGPVI